MRNLTITVDGRPGDIEDLYQVLTASRLPPGVELTTTSSRDGTLGVVDAIIAAVGSASALAGLAIQIANWKTLAKSKVRFELGNGKGIMLENTDPAMVALIWDLIQESPEQDSDEVDESD